MGGIPEAVVEGETGLLFDPGRADELAGCIGRLAGDPELRERMGQAGAARSKLFDPAAILAAYRGVYTG
ncbi:MAG: hypothetical protein CMJ49_11090 [Planctomycetaceae bacterium]|nr:hypothetical protein [Planctomycetaceae bacterium]